MPQLDPNPWFAILLFSWMVFLLVIAPKATPFVFPNDSAPTALSTMDLTPWTWPWP